MADFLKRIPIFTVVIDTAVAALSATLIKKEIIAENMDLIGKIGSIVIILSLLLVAVVGSRIHTWLIPALTLAIVAFIALVGTQLLFVKRVSPYGADERDHLLLVGYSLTDVGRAWAEKLKSTEPAVIIRSVGDGSIPEAWGKSFYVVGSVYVSSYLLLLLATSFTIGALEQRRM
jgi:hypothetical protein